MESKESKAENDREKGKEKKNGVRVEGQKAKQRGKRKGNEEKGTWETRNQG